MSAKRTYDIIAVDANVIVVNKPAGILCIPGRDNSQGALSLVELLRSDFGEVNTVHRIDRDTSGLVVFARTAESHKRLSEQFMNRLVSKKYLALVKGVPMTDQFTVEAPLVISNSGKVITEKTGKSSITHFNVLERFKRYALIEASPLTGRQHQIRVHLQYAGFPLIVDPLYHTSQPLSIDDIKRNAVHGKHAAPRSLLSRTPLHAQSLQFQNSDGDIVLYDAPVPKDMRATINQLRKWLAPRQN